MYYKTLVAHYFKISENRAERVSRRDCEFIQLEIEIRVVRVSSYQAVAWAGGRFWWILRRLSDCNSDADLDKKSLNQGCYLYILSDCQFDKVLSLVLR